MTGDRRHNTGILWMLISVGCFAVMHAMTKSLATHYSPFQLGALRGWISLPLLCLWLTWQRGWGGALHVRWSLQIARGTSTLLTVVCVAFALKVLPLADAYSIGFVGPLIIAALSMPVLKERVDATIWIAIATGFVGAMIVVRPTGLNMLTLGGLVMLLSAIGYAGSVLMIRVLNRTDTSLATMLWGTTVISLGAGILSISAWTPVGAQDWPMVVGIAVAGVLGQYTLVEALRHAAASVIAPFEYGGLVWGMALDWLLWSKLPNGGMLAGTLLIVISGFYVLQRERRAVGPVSADSSV